VRSRDYPQASHASLAGDVGPVGVILAALTLLHLQIVSVSLDSLLSTVVLCCLME
jgi:hypothetical protein